MHAEGCCSTHKKQIDLHAMSKLDSNYKRHRGILAKNVVRHALSASCMQVADVKTEHL